MALPKYLSVKKKIPYNIRMPEHLLNKLNAYADLTENTTTNVVINILNDFMKDKIVFNDYLADVKSKTIKIPIGTSAKSEIIKTHYILNEFDGWFTYAYTNNSKHVKIPNTTIEIKRIPNNLDKFDGYSYHSGNKHQHKGIEFFVYTPKEHINVKKYIDYLYCFYFEVQNDKSNIYLIYKLDAINRLANTDSLTKNLLIGCINELESLGSIESDYDKFLEIAEKYNSGNIVEFGTDIEKRIEINDAENKLSSDPKLIEYLLSKINQLEAHEKDMAETIDKLQKSS